MSNLKLSMSIFNVSYDPVREHSVSGRYVTLSQIEGVLQKVSDTFSVSELGLSVQHRIISAITVGSGPRKILMWSQMHGNESTTTKAILDLINFLRQDTDPARDILKNCTLKVIPILNPDGARAYTRVNANEIDLNRDAKDLSQPESVILRSLYEDFQPDYCFNLHDQRTIFNVGTSSKPATVSFLAPAHDTQRSISPSRLRSMQLIVTMRRLLQKHIPDQIGRYDDAFNPNCIGDTFQMSGTPTVLFEAGHFQGDYQREKTREYIFHALVGSLNAICDGAFQEYDPDEYFSIPENRKLFYDILIENAHVLDSKYKEGECIGILFKELLKDGIVVFDPKIEQRQVPNGHFGHLTYNCQNTAHLQQLKDDVTIYQILI